MPGNRGREAVPRKDISEGTASSQKAGPLPPRTEADERWSGAWRWGTETIHQLVPGSPCSRQLLGTLCVRPRPMPAHIRAPPPCRPTLPPAPGSSEGITAIRRGLLQHPQPGLCAPRPPSG